MAARACPTSADVPEPTLSSTKILPRYKAPNFLHLPGQALFVCTTTQQVKDTGSAIKRESCFSYKHDGNSAACWLVYLRFINTVRPPSRCLVEAWSLLRQHSNRLNMEELLGFMYESCQELGLIKELLKLPLGLTEQVAERCLNLQASPSLFLNSPFLGFLDIKWMPKTFGCWVSLSGGFGEVSPGYRRSPEQRTTDGPLPSAGQVHPRPAAQPNPQDEPGGKWWHTRAYYYAIITAISWYTGCDLFINVRLYRKIFESNSIPFLFFPRMSETQSLKSGPTPGTL